MKKILLSISALFISAVSFAQLLPNGDFETPIANNQLPGWLVLGGNVTQRTSLTVNTQSGQQTLVSASGPRFITVSNTTAVGAIQAIKYPMASRPKSLRFLTCYFPVNAAERFGIAVLMTKYNGTTTDTVMNTIFASNTGTLYPWTNFSIDLTNSYDTTLTPDSAMVLFITSVAGAQANTTLALDDVKFSSYATAITGVQDAFSTELSVYPNPAASGTSVNVSYQLNSTANVSVELYDMQGRLVQTVVNESETYGNYTHSINTEGLPKGVYICKVKTDNQVRTSKVVIAE